MKVMDLYPFSSAEKAKVMELVSAADNDPYARP